MKAQCKCGHRHRVTSAHCGRKIRCICGTTFEVPSLRQLKLQAAENVIAENFSSPSFWSENGCFLCSRNAKCRILVYVQLKAEKYGNVVVSPPRRGIAIIHTVVQSLFGRFAGFGVLLADLATEKKERMLLQDEEGIEFPLFCCRLCASQSDLREHLSQALMVHELYLEMKEEYTDIRIASIAPDHKRE